MEIFIAICCDHHIDVVVRVFSTQQAAIDFCKKFARSAIIEELNEQVLTQGMVRDGLVYYATYTSEDHVRVEKSTLDPQE